MQQECPLAFRAQSQQAPDGWMGAPAEWYVLLELGELDTDAANTWTNTWTVNSMPIATGE